jgi:hypothetical protein
MYSRSFKIFDVNNDKINCWNKTFERVHWHLIFWLFRSTFTHVQTRGMHQLTFYFFYSKYQKFKTVWKNQICLLIVVFLSVFFFHLFSFLCYFRVFAFFLVRRLHTSFELCWKFAQNKSFSKWILVNTYCLRNVLLIISIKRHLQITIMKQINESGRILFQYRENKKLFSYFLSAEFFPKLLFVLSSLQFFFIFNLAKIVWQLFFYCLSNASPDFTC